MNVTGIKGAAIPVRGNDIDTDRIIPARFMKCVTFAGLGAYAFHDERQNTDGSSKKHPFDDARWAGHPVLVSNANFGCGSSREHAPQALKDYGVKAVVAESFAEIFAGNCCSLGIPAVTLSSEDIQDLLTVIEENPQTEVNIDVDAMTVKLEGKEWKATMPSSHRNALLDGSWDSTGVLLEGKENVAATAAQLPYMK
ncbi:MAG: 3-isopropylmalate dehydratase small subunit [Spirochaetales bacterium]|nr:3-isopropylmalate dehydratase small subunit [Spirochaetales bacterium]